MKKTYYAALLVLLCPPVSGAELVRQFSGDATATTAEFEVDAPWLLDWRVNSDYRSNMSIEVHLVDAVTGLHRARVLVLRYPGDNAKFYGLKLFDEGGRYRLRVSSAFTTWNLKIEQLTREEAALYTPRGQ